MTRHIDTGHELWSYLDEILVECPKCHSGTRILPVGANPGMFDERRLACYACGFLQTWKGTTVGFRLRDGHMTDPYLGQVLWLQAPLGSNVIWALNHRHLDELAALVSATQRQRRPDDEHGWANRSLASRLPKWMLAAANRARVVKVLQHLRGK